MVVFRGLRWLLLNWCCILQWAKLQKRNIRCGDMMKESSTFTSVLSTPNSKTCRQTSLFPLCWWEKLKFTEVRWPNPPSLTHDHFGLPPVGETGCSKLWEWLNHYGPAVFRLQTWLCWGAFLNMPVSWQKNNHFTKKQWTTPTLKSCY